MCFQIWKQARPGNAQTDGRKRKTKLTGDCAASDARIFDTRQGDFMENLGALALLLAVCLSVYAILASLIGKLRAKQRLIVSAQRAVYMIWALLTTASALLVYALITSDF